MQTETPPRKKSLSERIIAQTWIPTYLMPIMAVVMVAMAIIVPSRTREMTPDLQARDQAAVERAQAWVEALGFEPGPAVCRTVGTGSGWCKYRCKIKFISFPREAKHWRQI
jgi:hypothetical protein